MATRHWQRARCGKRVKLCRSRRVADQSMREFGATGQNLSVTRGGGRKGPIELREDADESEGHVPTQTKPARTESEPERCRLYSWLRRRKETGLMKSLMTCT